MRARVAAAIGAGIGAGRQFHLHPGKVVRDGTALRFVLRLDVPPDDLYQVTPAAMEDELMPAKRKRPRETGSPE